MNNNLQTGLIPVHLDALQVPPGAGMEVAAPAIDFTRLDDPTLPYLGESLRVAPMSTIKLEAGVHLHWSLPAALCKTMNLPIVRKHAFQKAFGAPRGNAIWEVLLLAKWLQAKSKETAKVLPEATRGAVGIPPERMVIVNRLLQDAAFPAVPNRWLVTRLAADGTPEKQWMVESDYVWPDKDPAKKGRYTAYPKVQANGLGYCYVGRWYEADAPPQGQAAYLPEPLTATGYGEPAFAAFYPNCRSVFGFCDTANTDTTATYEVLGWYSNPAEDYFSVFVADFLENTSASFPYTELMAALTAGFSWFFPITVPKNKFSDDQWALMQENGWLKTGDTDSTVLDNAAWEDGNTLGPENRDAETAIRTIIEAQIREQLPGRTLCYARCTAGPATQTGPATNPGEIRLSVGNTGSEAMSAFLANQIAPAQKTIVEDYIEARQLSARLEHRHTDLGPKFEEARLEKGFVALPGGTIWALRPQNASNKKAGPAIPADALPAELADVLNELNVFQQQLDQTNFKIESLQQQVFTDWCRYLLGESDLKNALNPGTFSNQYDRDFNNQYTAGFKNQQNKTTGVDAATTLARTRTYIEWEIDVALKKLQQDAALLLQKRTDKLKWLKTALASLHSRQPLVIQPVAAPRYWLPAEPTLLVAGLQPDPRYGQNKHLLHCCILKESQPENFRLSTEQIKKAVQGHSAFQTGKGGDWHPLLMDWAVSFKQALNNYDGNQDDYQYVPSYIEDNYTLLNSNFSRTPRAFSARPAVPFSGRSILTPSGSLLQKDAAIRSLVSNILVAMPVNAALDVAEFKKWIKTIEPADPDLAAMAEGPGNRQSGDAQVIRKWISKRLENASENNLPGIVAWYWTGVIAEIKKQHADAPDPAGNVQEFVTWASGRLKQKSVRDNLHAVMDYHIYRNLAGVHGLSQALGGFNKALLALSQSYQLDVANPRATDDPSKTFAGKVRDAVQRQNRHSPLEDGDFSPIRAGKMTIDRIHLIDNFGQYWPPLGQNLLETAPLLCADTMTPSGSGEIALPPRLAEPARLNFRWLSSNHNAGDDAQDRDLVEMNSHPATNPICGWLLPNNLDNSLMVYSQDGHVLGYIEQGGYWRVFPGHDGPALPQEIENPHLRRMAQWLCQTGKSQNGFIHDFISVLDTALDNIAPDNSDQHDALSILMGRPVALVRAAVSLEHKGGNPVNQSQHIFLEDLSRFADALASGQTDTFERNTFAVDQVNIPLRMGEFRQLNDGLVGYWIDDAPPGCMPPGAQPDTFYAPQSFNPKKTGRWQQIMTHEEDGRAFLLQITPGQKKPLELSMLIDPRGKIHATCGLLPVKDIHLPPDQYKATLDRIEIAFLSTPILTLPDRLHLSVPREPGYGWSWVAMEDTRWKIVDSAGVISRADVRQAFPKDADTVWDILKTSGWIEETTAGNARVVPKDQRAVPDPDSKYAALLPGIEEMLERTRINPFDATAAFSGTPVIREGWLKLSKMK